MKPPPELVSLLEDSLRWSRDHRGELYKHALPCERCLAMGLSHGIGTYTGETGQEVFDEYNERIKKEKKRKVVKKRPTTTKRIVVRRKR